MQKLAKGKPKKKNIETGILMGQNTNVFSQLSATFLQHKTSNTEEQQSFLKNTNIIQYHDHNINRLIALLRKKAEVTKIKAAMELHQEINKMGAEQLEEFISTFAQLYSEVVVNEPSKQIVDEFVSIVTEMITNHKKIVVGEISTFYPAFLISHKLGKLGGLLFSGAQQQIAHKLLVLLMKKEVRKKFVIMVKIIMDCEAGEKITQPHYQRNCQALMRVLRQLIRMFDKNEKAQSMENDFAKFLTQICQSFGSECLAEYFKIGGKAKAAINELYTHLVSIAARRPKWELNWQAYAKTVGQHFLDKDPLVQQTLWRGSVCVWLEGLLEIERAEQKQAERGKILNTYLPKTEERVISALGLGGFSLYKELPHFCQIFPSTVFDTEESHKQLVNKLNFMRKLMTELLKQDDENQARMECYAILCEQFLLKVRNIVLPGDEKKAKEIQSLQAKLEKQLFQNLQDRYYKEPPASKNSFSYYIPQHFANIVNRLKPNYEFKFNSELTYDLYKGLEPTEEAQNIIDNIFQNSKKSQALTLKYLEAFPRRQVALDMSQNNPEVQNAAKIFLLVREVPQNNEQWMEYDWDIRKQLIAFDPRITLKDIQAQQEQQISQMYNLYFRPSGRQLAPKYDNPALDLHRFKYFYECLQHEEASQYVKFMIPLVGDVILPRNKKLTDQIFSLFVEKCQQAEKGKWGVSRHEVLIVRVLAQFISQIIVKEKGVAKYDLKKVQISLENFCELIRLLFAYRMETEADDLLRKAQSMLVVEDVREYLFTSCMKSIKMAWTLLLCGNLEGPEKIRKNRVRKCLQLINKLLWFCLPHSKKKLPFELTLKFIGDSNNWTGAASRPEPWQVAQTIMVNVQHNNMKDIASHMLDNYQSNLLQLNCILSLDWLLPLQALPEIRSSFISLRNILQEQISSLQESKFQALLRQLIRCVMQQQQITLSEGLRSLLVNILIEKEQDNESLLTILTEPVVVGPYEQYVKNSQNIYHIFIYNTVVNAIPLRKIDYSSQICAELSGQLLTVEGVQFLMILSANCLLWNKGIGSAQAMDDDGALLRKVLAKAIEALGHASVSGSAKAYNFGIYAIFSLINVTLGLGGKVVVEDKQKQIEKLFWCKLERGSEMEGLALSVKMRYASRVVLSASEQFLARLIAELPEIINLELGFYEELLRNIEEDQEIPHHESIISLFIQAAEFLLRASSYVVQNRTPSEATLLNLVRCPFPALRKASFLLLKSMYENKYVSRDVPEQFKAALKVELKDDELSSELCREASSYFYAWQLLTLRRQATERRPENQEELGIQLEDIIQSGGYSDLFIKNCFFILEDRLDYLKKQNSYPLTPQQLIDQDMQLDFLQESDLQQRMFKLTMRTLFMFVCNFPIFLKDFMAKFKRYRNICQRLLRNVLSDAIFQEEVGKIEVLEPQWKADGNFEIYVTPNNKEIYAEYTHDAIRIGMRLVMKNIYPIIPIAVEFGENLKMEQSGRLALMLQTQLQNRNTSVIKAILLWKQNIDKKLSGVEECAICFDIVNNNGQLPKKACKTCSKKFHGNCIMKWFSKSNKSQCPLCKSQFL